LKSGETAVRGDQWPVFLYARYEYDPKDLWKGLLHILNPSSLHGYKHVFMSLSLVDKEPKATCSGNAYLHGMKSVTQASLAYIATQARKFDSTCLPSLIYFCVLTQSPTPKFYHTILDLLEDPDECEEVADLMTWWMQFVI
ncbi:hypothetical protein BDR07DRAFT_1239674, partial [Suillus spraguei]